MSQQLSQSAATGKSGSTAASEGSVEPAKQKDIMDDVLQVLDLKRAEQSRVSMRFLDESLESLFSQNHLPTSRRAHMVLLVFLLLQQLISRVIGSQTSENTMWIFFMSFNLIALALTSFLKMPHLQILNFFINLIATLTLAECFESDEDADTSSKLRVFYNGMAVMICFWVHSSHLILDMASICLCLIIAQVFRGVTVSTVLFSAMSMLCVVFLKSKYYDSNRQTFQAKCLSEFWQKVIFEEINTLQIIALHYDKKRANFQYRGSLNSSKSIPKIETDSQVSHLLESMLLMNVIKAPNYQLKELSRSIGKNVKEILVKLLDDINWSFYSKSEKIYILQVHVFGFEYKVNIRGLNSLDDTFVMTMGLADNEAVEALNQRCEIAHNLLQLSVENQSLRLEHMRMSMSLISNTSTSQEFTSNSIMIRTMESLAYQSNSLRQAYQAAKNPNRYKFPAALKRLAGRQLLSMSKYQLTTVRNDRLSQNPISQLNIEMSSFQKKAMKNYSSSIAKKSQTAKNESSQQIFKDATVSKYFMQHQQQQNQQQQSQENPEDPIIGVDDAAKQQYMSQQQYQNSNQQQQFLSPLKKSDGNPSGRFSNAMAFVQSIQPISPAFSNQPHEDGAFDDEDDSDSENELTTSSQPPIDPLTAYAWNGEGFLVEERFDLRKMIEDVASLYKHEVKATISMGPNVIMGGSSVHFRWFLISLFENAATLKSEENITSEIAFLQDKEVQVLQDTFSIELKVSEKKQSSIQKILRYANGKNLPLIASIETAKFLDYIGSIGAGFNPLNFTQDSKSNIAKLTINLLVDWQKEPQILGAQSTVVGSKGQQRKGGLIGAGATMQDEYTQSMNPAQLLSENQNFTNMGEEEEFQRPMSQFETPIQSVVNRPGSQIQIKGLSQNNNNSIPAGQISKASNKSRYRRTYLERQNSNTDSNAAAAGLNGRQMKQKLTLLEGGSMNQLDLNPTMTQVADTQGQLFTINAPFSVHDLPGTQVTQSANETLPRLENFEAQLVSGNVLALQEYDDDDDEDQISYNLQQEKQDDEQDIATQNNQANIHIIQYENNDDNDNDDFDDENSRIPAESIGIDMTSEINNPRTAKERNEQLFINLTQQSNNKKNLAGVNNLAANSLQQSTFKNLQNKYVN